MQVGRLGLREVPHLKSAKCRDNAISSSFFSCMNGTYDLFPLSHSTKICQLTCDYKNVRLFTNSFIHGW